MSVTTASPLSDGYSDVAPGKLASVHTYLEMLAKPELRPEHTSNSCGLRFAERPEPDWYRNLFRRVGEQYLWASRLIASDKDLRSELHSSDVEVFVLDVNGEEAGLLQLDFREPASCELALFGLTTTAIGHGVGRWLMNRAIELAWSRPILRFWVHTCSLDHPAAMAFYMRSGFVPYKRGIEIYDDPRLAGVLSKDAAPHVPQL
jgi:GNAT superfamily N-acetyltransferase